MTEEPKSLGTHTTQVTPSITNIVMRCLGKDPAGRPESASAIVAALEGASTPAAMPAVTPAFVKTSPSATIAVLPFANMSGDPDNEYFSDGITDDLIVALTQLKGLKVAARTSSFAFKGKQAELSSIGSTLGVHNVLQGSVRRAGNRVRVTVQLMSSDEGTQLWSERYDRDLDDIFAIQDEIVRGIVSQLKVTLGLERLTGQLVAPPTDDLEAYQLYLRGREAAYLRSPASLRRAIEYFRQALARDPNYARAHLGLAEAHIGLGVYQYIPTIQAADEAIRALNEAERLRPDLAMLHVLWGQLKLYLRADWHEAGSHFERARAIDPNEPLVYAYSAFLNGMLGNLEASKADASRAVALDPLSLFVRAVSVMGFPIVGIPGADTIAALEAHDAALAMEPNAFLHLWMSAIRLGELGRHAEAVARLQRAMELSQWSPLVVGMYARAVWLAGRREEALKLAGELTERAARPNRVCRPGGVSDDGESRARRRRGDGRTARSQRRSDDRADGNCHHRRARARGVTRSSSSRTARPTSHLLGDSARRRAPTGTRSPAQLTRRAVTAARGRGGSPSQWASDSAIASPMRSSPSCTSVTRVGANPLLQTKRTVSALASHRGVEGKLPR